MKKNKIVIILFIIIGIVTPVITGISYYNKYTEQKDWIKTECSLDRIVETKPYAQGGTNPDGYQWYGVYYYNDLELHTYPVSEKKYIDDNVTFYINPENYMEYHEEYSKWSIFRGIGFVGFVFIGIIYIYIDKEK